MFMQHLSSLKSDTEYKPRKHSYSKFPRQHPPLKKYDTIRLVTICLNGDVISSLLAAYWPLIFLTKER